MTAQIVTHVFRSPVVGVFGAVEGDHGSTIPSGHGQLWERVAEGKKNTDDKEDSK